MIESSINVNFVFEEDVQDVLAKITDSIDSGDLPVSDYSEANGDGIILRGESVPRDIRVHPANFTPYAYNSDVLSLPLLGEDLVSDSDDLEYLGPRIEFIKQLYEQTSPQYVFGIHTWVSEGIGTYVNSPVTDDGLAQNQIDWPTWLMIFSPPMVEEYGRERLMDLPVARAEELSDGGILIVATYDIVECSTDQEIAQTIAGAVSPIRDAFDIDPPENEYPSG